MRSPPTGRRTRERVQLNKAVAGWLSHSGFAHGGNGYEGIAFLIEQFAGTGLADPADPRHGLDLEALAAKCAAAYAKYKTDRKSSGSLEVQKIPGVNHPVFKDKPVNYDPREVFVHDLRFRPHPRARAPQLAEWMKQHPAERLAAWRCVDWKTGWQGSLRVEAGGRVNPVTLRWSRFWRYRPPRRADEQLTRRPTPAGFLLPRGAASWHGVALDLVHL